MQKVQKVKLIYVYFFYFPYMFHITFDVLREKELHKIYTASTERRSLFQLGHDKAVRDGGKFKYSG